MPSHPPPLPVRLRAWPRPPCRSPTWCVPRPRAAQAAGPRGGVFRHGVASGDPRADRVILWTRVSGATRRGARALGAGRNPTFTRVVARGETPTGAARDFTVKVDVTGLCAGHHLLLPVRRASARRSPVGRTRTLPAAGVARAALGAGLVRELPARLLQRLRPHRRARRRRRRAAPRRLHLRVRTGPLRRRRAGRRSRRRPAARDHGARRLPPPLRPLSHRPRPAGGAPPASVHRGVGRPRDRQQHLERPAPRTTSPTRATSSRAATPRIRRSSSGCRCATPARRASRSSTGRSPSAISPTS